MSEPSLHLRLATERDLAAIVDVFTASIHHLGERHYDQSQRDAWAPRSPDMREWSRRLATVTTLVAEIDGGVAGFIAFEPNGHVDLLYVSPDAAQRGVASALYLDAERRLSAAGIHEVFTESSLVAAPFFARQGFQVVEEQTVERRGISFRRFGMRKTIQGSSAQAL